MCRNDFFHFTYPAHIGLECLYWGLYFNRNTMVASKKGIHMLAQKWSNTLRELDLANQPFSEEDLEITIGHLAHGAGVDSFNSLNLSGTKISSSALRYSRPTSLF